MSTLMILKSIENATSTKELYQVEEEVTGNEAYLEEERTYILEKVAERTAQIQVGTLKDLLNPIGGKATSDMFAFKIPNSSHFGIGEQTHWIAPSALEYFVSEEFQAVGKTILRSEVMHNMAKNRYNRRVVEGKKVIDLV